MDFIDTVFLQQLINGLSQGAIFALFALGYALVFSILGVLNLAHSAVFMWGAFIGLLALDGNGFPSLLAVTSTGAAIILTAYLIEKIIHRVDNALTNPRTRDTYLSVLRLGSIVILLAALYFSYELSSDFFSSVLADSSIIVPPIVAMLLAMVGSGAISVGLEFVAFRPLRERNAARIAQLISSIGAALLLVNMAQFVFIDTYNLTEAYYPRDLALLPFIPTETILWEVGGGVVRIAPIRLVILVVATVLMVVLQYVVQRTQIGQQMRAVSYNQQIASLLGINVSRVYIITFFLAGAFGGAAGMLYGMVFLQTTPFIGESISLIGLTAIVLGGMGSIGGALVGGFLVALIQTFSIALGGSGYRDAIVFLLLFIVLLVRPQGLFGQPEQTRA